jgi:hypothetical protein
VVTAPLFLLLAFVAYICLKTKAVAVGGVVLGVLLGLTLASTGLGGPIINGLQTGTSAAVAAMTSVLGGS